MFRKMFNKSSSDNKSHKKKRISPSARSPDGMAQVHPMYQYAMNEYAQTVAPATSNDDGMSVFSAGVPQRQNDDQDEGSSSADLETARSNVSQASAASSAPSNHQQHHHYNRQTPLSQQQPSMSRTESDLRSRSPSDVHSPTTSGGTGFGKAQVQPSAVMSPQAEYVLTEVSTPLPSPPSQHHSDYAQHQHQRHNFNNTGRWTKHNHQFAHSSYADTSMMPDATYEEYYGDAYVGGPIRYIYPSGYQSMRPRSGPWKLSIVVCLMMSWLSVFIIGHCSDRVDQSLYNQNEIDDDTFVIEIRWCGSRLLYWMWVVSMLITGIATAYCSVIGYIKVRDFAVGNMRSQPPGMLGKSDYYVQIHDNGHGGGGGPDHHPGGGGGGGGSSAGSGSDGSSAAAAARYQRTIYQADGTPQFWGHHIYRPTQAAVAITSR